jgi:excisionase family DNA binding protein
MDKGNILSDAIPEPEDKMLTPGQVAKRFGVDPKTVTRWANSGKLESIRTPGRHRRFSERAVNEFFDQNNEEQ